MKPASGAVFVVLVILLQIVSPSLQGKGEAGIRYVMVAPKTLYTGTEASVTVDSLSVKTNRPVNAPVDIYILDLKGSRIDLFSGWTGPDGHQVVRFHVPRLQRGTYTIVLENPRTHEQLTGQLAISAGITLLLETDKPIYKPGQTVHGRVLAVNSDLKPVSVSLNVSISDSKGIRVFRKPLVTNGFGVAAFDMVLAREVNLGTWKIVAQGTDSMSTVDIRVEKYVLPKFKVDVALPRDWFLVDEEISGRIDCRYFFGKPVQGMVEVRAYKYLAEWEQYASFRGELEDGSLSFTLPPVSYVAGTYGAGGMGSVMLNVTVTDGSGHQEEASRLVKIAPSSTVIQLIPSAETIKPGLPMELLVVTETPGGEPMEKHVSVEARFVLDDGSTISRSKDVSTFRGTALIEFDVPEKCTSAEVVAQVPEDKAESRVTLRSMYSPSGYFIHIRQTSEGAVKVGDEVTFKVFSTGRRTLYYDVVAGGRAVFSGYTTGRYISFKVTPSMMPRARIVVYTINPNMEISADSLPFDVEIEAPVGLSAEFSNDTASPGDTVLIDLRSSRGVATMIGLSIVDESVYALNEGRLNLKQIFDELEKIFMEPRAEAHPEERFWGAPLTKGARDVFEESGLQVIASKDIVLPEGYGGAMILYAKGGVREAEAGMDLAHSSAPQSEGTEEGLAEVRRIRQFFPETWYWNATLLTDDTGHTTLRLTVPDSITTWRLHAVSSSSEGIGLAEASLRVFQDFFVEPDLPYAVTRGEEFPVMVQIYNYLSSSQKVQVSITPADWFTLLDEAVKTVQIPGNSVVAVSFMIKPVKIGQFKVEITARSPRRADAVRREMLVEPEGVRREEVVNGFITEEKPATLDLSLPEGIVNDSARVMVSITPSLVGQVISGVEDLLGMPYGCGEQNMMFMAPDLEILRYLDATDQLVPEVRAKAELYLTTGYQRELTFRRGDGSFSAFGSSDEEGSLWLTAFVLDVFSEAREVLAVDEKVLADAANWIESHQNSNGSWSPVGFVVHGEMMGGLNPGSRVALTSFVSIALADYGRASEALERGIRFIEENGLGTGDPYAAAISAYLLEKVGSSKADEAISELLKLASSDENGLYWSPAKGGSSGVVEATSYAALALMLAGRSEAEQAVRWIASQRNSLGGFCSTQDTVMAMKALMTAARLQSRNIDSVIHIVVDGREIQSLRLTRDNFDVLNVVSIPLGGKELELRLEGGGKVMFQLVKRFNVPWEPSGQKEFEFEVSYNTTTADVNDVVGVTARVRYNGPHNSTGMMILDVAVPTGFSVIQSSLDKVVSEGLASRVEVAARKVIFYIDDLKRGEEIEIQFQILAVMPVKARGGTSRAYSYYRPEDNAEAPPQPFEVKGEVQSKFGPQPAGSQGGGAGHAGVAVPKGSQLPLWIGLLLVVSLPLAGLLARRGRLRDVD